MNSISFNVVGTPKPQPRPRACVRGKHAGVYDPGTAESWKAAVREEAMKHQPETPLAGSLGVVLLFTMPRPKAHFRTGAKSGELKANAPTAHTNKPDLDNLTKATLDALSDISMWRDDSHVCYQVASKQYGHTPGCEVMIETQATNAALVRLNGERK